MSNTETTYALPTLSEYQAASGPDKVKMRTAAEREIKRALAADEFVQAKAVNAGLSEWAPAKAAKVEIDWTALVAVRVASLRAAADGIEAGDLRVNGTPDDFEFTMPEGEIVADDATITRLVSLKVGNSKAAASDLQAAIDEVFAGRESGEFLTCQEIKNLAGLPSSGAVAARLFAPKGCTLKGVTPVLATADHAKGARKI